jgi:uncharacterized DUF497 family protein
LGKVSKKTQKERKKRQEERKLEIGSNYQSHIIFPFVHIFPNKICQINFRNFHIRKWRLYYQVFLSCKKA